MQSVPENFAAHVVEFCRFARDQGLSAATKESIDALQAVQTLGISDRETLKTALRAVLCSSKEDWDVFDEIFEGFWRVRGQARQPREPLSGRKKRKTAASQRPDSLTLLLGSAGSAAETEEGRAVLGAAAVERLKKVDFSEIPQGDLLELERLSLRLIRQMSLRVSRRLKAMVPSGRVDIRRTIRHSISRGGDLLELSFKGKKRERSRLVILLDVSGSMNAYSLFLLKFVYALQRHFRHVSTFLFSTRLEEIGAALRSRRLSEALAALSAQASGWSGGTKIGESLREFNLTNARRILTRDALFLILSDGWDTGEPEILAGELAAIKRRARKLIWLNPLLGMSDYQPLTRGMTAALPLIDVFAPAHNLESLLALERYLAR